jgi:beta-galactosidase/beta-glucuronidase
MLLGGSNTAICQNCACAHGSALKKALFISILALASTHAFAQPTDNLNLAGQWRFALDPESQGEAEHWFSRDLDDTIPLPGTTDLAGKGYPLRRDTMDYGVPILESDWPSKPAPARADEAGHLVRDFYYVGKTWYQRTIDVPSEWQSKHLRLYLERVLWRSDVWVDDRYIGNADSLATPHCYDLGKLEPGTHRLTVRVDNALQCNIGIATHTVGPETQSQWNGIVGAIRLSAEDPIFIAALRTFPSPDRRSVRVEADLRNTTGAPWKGPIELRIEEVEAKICGKQTQNIECIGDTQTVSLTVPLDEPAKPWDEFSTPRYRIVSILGNSQKASLFGFRQIERNGRRILINGRPVYLRGTLDCCVYPKTGHPPVTVDEWLRVLGTVKAYGFNHVRFHTWCPPEAAFEAADRLGIYCIAA